jgi:hypothetical protein
MSVIILGGRGRDQGGLAAQEAHTRYMIIMYYAYNTCL